MADEEQLRILREGVAAWKQWRGKHPGVWPDLRGADLRGANLCGADLGGTHLRVGDFNGKGYHETSFDDLDKLWFNEADFSKRQYSDWGYLVGANLSKADFSDANLRETDLRLAELVGTNLSGAKLIGADLRGANLRWANLSQADLNQADLGGAIVSRTVFGEVDLSEVKGLESVEHYGPSTIGIDTIYKSKGRIPEVFLRGCGVPDEFIAYISSFVAGKAIQFYSCFISYSSKDQAFADRLHADMQAKGVRCWFAPEDLKIGDKIWERLDQSIRLHDKLLVILSANSIGSAWVEDEVMAAVEEERRRHQTVLFPVRLDDAVMETSEAWAGLVRQRHIGDFRAWKEHDAYREGFERLLRDLKAG